VNFYKRYLGDYARDTAHLSLMEHGAYQVLLDTYYATDGKLTADSEELYRIARAMNQAERKAVDKVADQFFPVNGDNTRHNKRADEELHAYVSQADTNRRIAVAREAKRKEHGSLHASCDGSCSDRATNDQPKPEAIKELRSKTPAAPPERGVWDEVRTVLAEAGIPLESARSLVGKWLKDWPEDTVRDAILEARGTQDPKAFTFKLLQSKPKKPNRNVDYTAGAR
jgi:uncharacterized protein YdaU (DUF1376 family)